MKRSGVALALASAVLLTLSGCITIQAASVGSPPAPEPTKTERPWIPTPEGFTRGGDVAYRWVEPGTVPCTPGASCYHVEVYAFDNCPDGVYLEANLLDKPYGLVIGSTSGTLASLKKGQTGRIELPVIVPSVGAAEMASSGCF